MLSRPDHCGGFVVAIVFVITGLRVLRDASLELVDTMPEPELTGEIVNIARAVAGVQGIDKVFARKTGLQYHGDLHIEVDPTLTIAASHAIGGHVRATLTRELPWVADVLVHVEPSQYSGTTAVRVNAIESGCRFDRAWRWSATSRWHM